MSNTRFSVYLFANNSCGFFYKNTFELINLNLYFIDLDQLI